LNRQWKWPYDLLNWTVFKLGQCASSNSCS
jgi:hypothetical protein